MYLRYICRTLEGEVQVVSCTVVAPRCEGKYSLSHQRPPDKLYAEQTKGNTPCRHLPLKCYIPRVLRTDRVALLLRRATTRGHSPQSLNHQTEGRRENHKRVVAYGGRVTIYVTHSRISEHPAHGSDPDDTGQ